jgi:hypothetical protein
MLVFFFLKCFFLCIFEVRGKKGKKKRERRNDKKKAEKVLSLFLFSLPGEFKHIINRRKRKKI